MPEINKKPATVPELNAIKEWFPEIARQINVLRGRLRVQGDEVRDLPEMWELLWKLALGFEALTLTMEETFATVLQEPTLPNSRRLAAGANITLTDEGPQKRLIISGEAGGAAQCPVIDQITSLCEWDHFISGGVPETIYPPDPEKQWTEDFRRGSSTLQDGATDFWQNVGSGNGVVEKTAGVDASWTYAPSEGDNNRGGLELSGGSTSKDIIEYQSNEVVGVSVRFEGNDFFDIVFLIYVEQASNGSYGTPPFASTPVYFANYEWRIGITKEARLTDPPANAIFLEKLSGGTAATGGVWKGVCVAGGTETRTAIMALNTPGPQTLRIRVYQSGKIGFMASGGGNPTTESFVDSNVPTGDFNVFVQVCPEAAAVDSHIHVRAYLVDNGSDEVIGAVPPSWSSACAGKLGWAAAFYDERGLAGKYGEVNTERNDFTDEFSRKHPGVIGLMAYGPNANVREAHPSNSESSTASAATLFTPYRFTGSTVDIGHQFVAGTGSWKKRFIVHLGRDSAPWLLTSSDFMCGIAIFQPAPQPPLFIAGSPFISGVAMFYVISDDSLGSASSGTLHFYNDLTSASPDDIDTGIVVAEPAQWFIAELEYVAGAGEFNVRVYDEVGVLVFETTSEFDVASWGDFPFGPFYTSSSVPGTAQDSTAWIDAYGYTNEGILSAA